MPIRAILDLSDFNSPAGVPDGVPEAIERRFSTEPTAMVPGNLQLRVDGESLWIGILSVARQGDDVEVKFVLPQRGVC